MLSEAKHPIIVVKTLRVAPATYGFNDFKSNKRVHYSHS